MSVPWGPSAMGAIQTFTAPTSHHRRSPNPSFVLPNYRRWQCRLCHCVESRDGRNAIGRPPFAEMLDSVQPELCRKIIQNRESHGGHPNIYSTNKSPSQIPPTHLSFYRTTADGRAGCAVALNREAGVMRLADLRLPKCSTACSQSSADRFRRSRIGGAFFGIAPRFSTWGPSKHS